MARFRNKVTGAVVSVSDEKNDRFRDGTWERHDGEPDPPVKRGPKNTESDDSPFAALTIPKLKAEISRRNDGRTPDAMISADGNKADLIAALNADDAAAAPAATEAAAVESPAADD